MFNKPTQPGTDTPGQAYPEIPPPHIFEVSRFDCKVRNGVVETLLIEAHRMEMLTPQVARFMRYYIDAHVGPAEHLVRQVNGYIDIAERVEDAKLIVH